LVVLFARMFLDCNVAEKFGVGHTKASYSVRHGLGPVIHDELAKDINLSSNMRTLEMDETTAEHVIKEMDILIRYKLENDSTGLTKYLDS